jgi:hypothetical protein
MTAAKKRKIPPARQNTKELKKYPEKSCACVDSPKPK